MGDLTAHFDLAEFASRDGAPFPDDVSLETLTRTATMLEALREGLAEEIGHTAPVIILSGYRSPAHNAAVGGVPGSYHMKGMAADVVCQSAIPSVVQRVALRLQARGIIGGVGKYAGFTHVDIGPQRTWDETTKAARGGAVA